MTGRDVTRTVREAVADTLGIGVDGLSPRSAIVADLGAGSLDVLDILFRVECALETVLPGGGVGALLQGAVADGDFCDAGGVLGTGARARVARLLPGLAAAGLPAGLRLDQLLDRLTVDDLTALVRGWIAAPAPAAAGARPCTLR